ncbi:tRNA lysidine(34) synthetase TilS, partial [Micromonospora provocatoris]
MPPRPSADPPGSDGSVTRRSPSPAPAVAAVRLAVRRMLTGLPGDGPVLVACS